MAEWTWLFTRFPLADMELVSVLPPRVANVLVRTIRQLPNQVAAEPATGPVAGKGEAHYLVRVAPHPVAPFRGGPWVREFAHSDLANPGPALAAFAQDLAAQVAVLWPESASSPGTDRV
ncbi:MAG: hypothetical protein K6T26_00210 [Alicyclobacillus sp.]|nr:hypothetical protein [Alicyclobacillus sp.]